MSEKVFRELPPPLRPKKLASEKTPNFPLAEGQPLPVRGLYEFSLRIDKKFIKLCYVIPDLNELLILGIDFIQQHPTGAKGT
jgi:hypothetical protein